MAELDRHHLRLPDELWERVVAVAAERSVPPGWVARKLIEEGLERLLPADEFRLARRRISAEPPTL